MELVDPNIFRLTIFVLSIFIGVEYLKEII